MRDVPPAQGDVAVFVVARMGATRLEGKVALDVFGLPMVVQQVERLRLAREAGPIVLCTTDSPADDSLAALAEKHGVPVFRGPELDVPRRLLMATEAHGVSHFILAEADEHFADPAHVDAVAARLRAEGGDWVHVAGNPIGAWIRGISRHALATLCSERDTEGLDGWGAFFEKDSRFAVSEFSLLTSDDQAFSEGLRLTIDYPEDFELLQELYRRLYRPGQPLRLDAVLAELRRDPSLIEINIHRQEQYWERLKERSGGLVQ